MSTIHFNSKLPHLPKSIFSKMSGLALQYNAINLSQGFPNYPTSKKLQELVNKAMMDGYNQYAPLTGDLKLKEVIAEKIEQLYKAKYHPENEVLITNGAQQAVYNTIQAFVQKGDEVIVFKPSYDMYEPCIKLNGGIPVLIQLKHPNYQIDWQEVEKKITEKTKMIVVNSPHNPTGSVLGINDIEALHRITKNTNIIILSDEVYDHMTFDNLKHHSLCSHSELYQRAVICCSFGKTFHNTGWRIGYCVAPHYLMEELVKIQENSTYSVFHPVQKAFASFLQDASNYTGLNDFFQEKRDLFLNGLKESKFKFIPSKGSYFQLLDYSAITKESDLIIAEEWTKKYGVASIPISVFNTDNYDPKVLRFCFAKTDETLIKATEILSGIQS